MLLSSVRFPNFIPPGLRGSGMFLDTAITAKDGRAVPPHVISALASPTTILRIAP